MILDGDDLDTPYDAVALVGAPVTPPIAHAVFPDAVAPASSGDDNQVLPGTNARRCDGDPVMPSATALMASHACAPSVLSGAVPRRRSWCLIASLFSYKMGLDRCQRNLTIYPVILSNTEVSAAIPR